MAIRTLDSVLQTSLLNYDPFIVVHLVKFEKPQSVIQNGGKIRGIATDYTYITDSQYDIEYNDDATDIDGTDLGPQTYRANKLTKLGTINESILAKASNLTMTLDSSSLGATAGISATFDAATTEMFTDIDLPAAGFQEGDKILLSGEIITAGSFVIGISYTIATKGSTDFTTIGAANSLVGTTFTATGVGTGTGTVSTNPVHVGTYIRIDGFRNGGKTAVYTQISSIGTETVAQNYTLTLSSEELNILLSDKSGTSYTNYINREVLIYKAHINPSDRTIIGEPFLYFKGITSGASITEKLDSSQIQWTLSSHWGDFLRVQGRLTDDATHRALRADSTPDLESVIKPSYASDLGFLHSNAAINAIATYNTKEIRYKNVSSGGLSGLLGGKESREYSVDVPRTTDLQFNTQAKMLPVVYGVHKIDSFPIFVDTHKTNSAEVYRVDALCEGPIAGVLDIHIEDNTTICLDAQDEDVRSTTGATYDADAVEVVCYGRQDRGDTLHHYSDKDANASRYGYTSTSLGKNGQPIVTMHIFGTSFRITDTGTNNATSAAATGILHEGSHTITSPISASFTFHSGQPNQAADSTLVSLASAGNFKVQSDYYTGNELYWGPSHQVLDTAYVVGKYTIADGETTLPEMQFVVRGRDPECYNYDGSYKVDSTHDAVDHNHVSDFNLNDTVELFKSGGTPISSAVIIDKWSSYDVNGDADHRFRFSIGTDFLSGSTEFYMKKGTKYWHMQAWDHAAVSAIEPMDMYNASLSNIGAGSNITDATVGTIGSKITLGTPSAQMIFAISHATAIIGVYNPSNSGILASSYGDFSYASYVIDNIAALTDTTGITRVYVKNAIALDTGSGTSTANGYYTGNKITLTDTVGGAVYTQVRTIVDYIGGTTKVAMVDEPWDYTNLPSSTSKYSIGSVGDRRITINPAMQLLDYMTNIRYGKGLDIIEDINLPTWISAARECDTRSDVTVVVPSGTTVVVDDQWSYPDSAPYQWRGKVHSFETIGGYKQVTFTDCIGKLGTKWNSWKVFASGDLYWNDGKAYTGGGSTITTAPTSGHLTTVLIGNGSTTADILQAGVSSANGNPIVKKYNPSSLNFAASGYSLYDADDVKYWRYIGWDDSSQRNVTRHQMNQVISTKSPLFDNINKMLQQFNGILRYSVGKYELDVKSKKSATLTYIDNGITYYPEKISEDDIVGTIKLTDKGLKNSKNYVSTSIIDPHNKFEGRSVSFFNSTYLKEDKGIQKKGQFSMPGITNYYNARFNIKQYLDESRYGLQVQFTMSPRGLLLLAGSVIEFTYPRFGYVDKAFRITNLNFKKDGLVDVTADEHNDDAYIVEAEGEGSGITQRPNNPTVVGTIPIPPSNLSATSTNLGEIVLTWDNSAKHNVYTHITEIHRGSTANFQPDDNLANVGTTYSLIGTSSNRIFHDPVSETPATRYYRIRYKVYTVSQHAGHSVKITPSLYYPLSGDPAVAGDSTALNSPRLIKIDPGATQNFIYNIAGDAIETNYASSTAVTTTTANTSSSQALAYTWTITGTPTAALPGLNSSTYLYEPTGAFADMPQTLKVVMTDTVGVGSAQVIYTATDSITFTAAKLYQNGVVGSDGSTYTATNGTHNFIADINGVISNISSFASKIKAFKGTQELTFNDQADVSGNYPANTFRYGTSTNILPSGSVTPVLVSTSNSTVSNSTAGIIKIESNLTDPFVNSPTPTYATFDVPIIDNSTGGSTPIAIFTFSLTKSLAAGPRGGSIFTFDIPGNATTGTAALWAQASFSNNTPNLAAAKAIAQLVINAAEDGYIRPNDRITVTDNNNSIAGTRIYDQLSATSSNVSIATADFSSLVVETFPGSVIVDGTLSADKITANAIFSNNLSIGSTMTLGSDSANKFGVFHTIGKSTYGSSVAGDEGFFLGYNTSSSKYELDIGGATNYVRWNGISLEVAGTIALTSTIGATQLITELGETAGSSSSGNSRTYMNNNGLIVVDATGAARVKIGNLSSLQP